MVSIVLLKKFIGKGKFDVFDLGKLGALSMNPHFEAEIE